MPTAQAESLCQVAVSKSIATNSKFLLIFFLPLCRQDDRVLLFKFNFSQSRRVAKKRFYFIERSENSGKLKNATLIKKHSGKLCGKKTPIRKKQLSIPTSSPTDTPICFSPHFQTTILWPTSGAYSHEKSNAIAHNPHIDRPLLTNSAQSVSEPLSRHPELGFRSSKIFCYSLAYWHYVCVFDSFRLAQ